MLTPTQLNGFLRLESFFSRADLVTGTNVLLLVSFEPPPHVYGPTDAVAAFNAAASVANDGDPITVHGFLTSFGQQVTVLMTGITGPGGTA